MSKRKIYTPYCDVDGERVKYGQLIDFTWWSFDGYSEVDLHFKAKIRYRKNGDIIEFYPRNGCKFTHRVSAINWCNDDLCVRLEDDKFYQ